MDRDHSTMHAARRTRTVTCTRASALLSLALLIAALAAGCESPKATPKSAETLAVESRAGDFLDYYGEVLRLSQNYAAHPDSFRAALDSLPGSHLTEKEWEAWIAPYRDDPRKTSDRLEKIIAGLKTPP
jgi:hypothetical protein